MDLNLGNNQPNAAQLALETAYKILGQYQELNKKINALTVKAKKLGIFDSEQYAQLHSQAQQIRIDVFNSTNAIAEMVDADLEKLISGETVGNPPDYLSDEEKASWNQLSELSDSNDLGDQANLSEKRQNLHNAISTRKTAIVNQIAAPIKTMATDAETDARQMLMKVDNINTPNVTSTASQVEAQEKAKLIAALITDLETLHDKVLRGEGLWTRIWRKWGFGFASQDELRVADQIKQVHDNLIGQEKFLKDTKVVKTQDDIANALAAISNVKKNQLESWANRKPVVEKKAEVKQEEEHQDESTNNLTPS